MSNYTNLISELHMPKVLWHQTDATVVMRIMIPGIESYFLLCDEDHVRFSTVIGERKYHVCIYLFGAVIPEKCMHINKGREVVVYLPKAHRWVNWLRLGIDKRNNPQINYDPDKVENQDELDLKLQFDKELNFALREEKRQYATTIPPAEGSSDGEESDDELYDTLFE